MRILFSIITCALLACCAIQSPQAGPVGFRLSSGFKPSQIPGLQLWLDASQITGLSDNDPVAAWDDLSGNANNATQGTASNRPTYKTNQLNGRPAVRLDGIDDWLTYPNDIFTYTGAGTVFALVKVNATQAMGYGSVLSVFGGVNQSIMACVQVYPNNAVEFCTDVYSPGGVRYNTTGSTSTWYLVTWTWSNWSTHKTNGSTKIRVNGVEGTVAAFGNNPSGLTVTRRAIGSTDLGGLSHLNGDIAALLAYNTQLTSDQISQVESYLNTQWGITFTPASIAGLQLWLDASQITGLNDGDAVATWNDLSGNGYNATQGTASARPTYQTAEQNSRAGVLADGVDDYLSVTNPTLTNCTMFVVGRMSASTTAYNPPISFRAVTPGVDVGAPFYLKSNNKWASYPFFNTGGSVDDVGTSASGTAYIMELPYELAGWSLIVNGSTLGSTTGTAYPSVAGVELFRQASPVRYFNGFLFEVLVWNRVLTSNERTTVRAYLNSKWAVY